MSAITPESPAASRRLLVVDDEPLVRQTLAFVLQDKYDVVTVGSGEEAIAASRREPFPVVILDLCMEGLSGIETLERLQRIQERQKVIILTAYESTETAVAALNLGAFNYLTKPFEREQLRDIVSRGFAAYERQLARERDMRDRLIGVHDSFFALLCHEFNTPLHAIMGFSELLATSLNDPEHAEWARDINAAGDRLHKLLMEIVDYTSASHLAAVGLEKAFTPGELLRRLPEEFAAQGSTLTLEPSPTMDTRLEGAADAIRLVARKLVRLAMHNSRRHGLAVSLEMRDGAHLRLRVRGTGLFNHTLGDEGVQQLFRPYDRTALDERSGVVSFGLELATSRKVADHACGTIEVSFDPQGEVELAAAFPVRLLA